MKKTYQIPTMTVTSVEVQNIIANSPLSVTKDGDTAGLNDTKATAGTDAMVKDNSYDVWSDDWSK